MFGNGFVWDDQQFIVGNPVLRSLWPLSRFFQSLGAVEEGTIYPMTGQRPLMTFSLALDHRLWKFNPFGYHLTNLILHLLCVFLVALFSWRMSQSREAGFLAGALFALHPGHAEGVIAFLGRSDLLATLFVLLGFWGYVKQDETSGRRMVLWFSASLSSFLLACFSKESGLVLLGILVVYKAFGLGNPPSAIHHPQPKIRLLRLFPFLLVALLYWFHRGRVLGGHAAGTEWWGGSPEKNFLMMFEVYARYLLLLVFPLRLSPLHTVPVPQSFWDANILFGGILLFGTLCTAVWALRRQPRIGFWISWFLLGLAPVANVIPIPGMIFAERWLYLPSVGACALGGWGAWTLYGRARGWVKQTWAGLVVLALALLGLRTFLWASAWRSEESVAQAIVATSPDSHVGRNNLGNVLLNQGKIAEAEIQLRESLRSKPTYFLAHNNLGIVLWKQGRDAEAEAEFREAIRCKPNYAEAHSSLGITLARRGEFPEAVRELREAIRLKPHLAEVHYNLGLALGRTGVPGEAEKAFREATRLDPSLADAYFNLGIALEEQGRIQEAVKEYRRYLVYAPYARDRGMVEARIRSLEKGTGIRPNEP
jgi:Flp pilus assembly protein TadD